MRRSARALVLAAMLAGAPSVRADVRAGGIELVHNAPVETSLATPDIRDPVTVWCAMIDAARTRIDFEQFYVAGQSGSRLDRVLASLEAAARRGVRIRFLMERKGEALSTADTIQRLRNMPNLALRLLGYSDLTGDGIIHAKFFIVDGRAAYLGSQNFDWRALEHIDETGLAIDDARIVGQMQRIFDFDWEAQQRIAAHRPVPAIAAHTPPATGTAYLVASPAAYDPAGVPDSQAELVRLIGGATREVRIELMTYAPLDLHGIYYGVIDQALRAAAQRGVAIRLLVADWNLTPAKLPYLKSLAVLPNVRVRFVTIPPAAAGAIPFARVVHTKTMTVDGAIAWVGTSNWEGGYLDRSRNLEVVLRNPVLVDRIVALHEQLWTSPYAHPLDASGSYALPPRQ